MRNIKKKFKIMLFVASIAASTLVAAAESGEGRNGPDKTGLSIPVGLDRFVTLDNLSKAISTCDSRFLKSIMSQITRQDSIYFKSTNQSRLNYVLATSKHHSSQESINRDQPLESITDLKSLFTDSSGSYITYNLSLSNRYFSASNENCENNIDNICRDKTKADNYSKYLANSYNEAYIEKYGNTLPDITNLPVFLSVKDYKRPVYLDIKYKAESFYDELGLNTSMEKVIVTSIKVLANDNKVRRVIRKKLGERTDEDEYADTSLIDDPAEYAQCIQNELN